MARRLKLAFSATALVVVAAIFVRSAFAFSSPIPLEPEAKNLIHISTRPHSADHVFVDIRIEENNPRVPDVRLKLSGLRLHVMRRTMTGQYEGLVTTGIDIWRENGNVHAYFVINKTLIEASTLDLVLDAPELLGENYHEVKLKEFIK